MKRKILSSLVVCQLLFIGCSKPFNHSERAIVFKDGEPYRVPFGSSFGLATLTTKEKINLATYWGIPNCKINDIIWVSTDYNNNSTKKNQESLKDIYKKGYQNYLAGCSSPLSDKEFKFYSGKEKQQNKFQHEQNIQDQKSFDKTLDRVTPKIHNVNILTY